MKKFIGFLLVFSFLSGVKSQEINDDNGKTYYYYDNQKKQLKEVFHHIRIHKFGRRGISAGADDYYDTVVYLKNGPYLKYFISGQLEHSGYYAKDKKDSTWLYYDLKGVLIKKERFIKGDLMSK